MEQRFQVRHFPEPIRHANAHRDKLDRHQCHSVSTLLSEVCIRLKRRVGYADARSLVGGSPDATISAKMVVQNIPQQGDATGERPLSMRGMSSGMAR
jgi:hypothetical protein